MELEAGIYRVNLFYLKKVGLFRKLQLTNDYVEFHLSKEEADWFLKNRILIELLFKAANSKIQSVSLTFKKLEEQTDGKDR